MSGNGKDKEFTAYITVRCAEATRDELAALAKDDKRSTSNYVRKVLEDHVEQAKAARLAGQEEPAAA